MTGRGRALILFSRLPIGHETKTRLSPLLNEEEREALHRAMWDDIFAAALALRDTDVFLYWTGSGRADKSAVSLIEDYRRLVPPSFFLREQRGENLGERMGAAMQDVLEGGETSKAEYSRAVLMGTDVPDVQPRDIEGAFDALNEADVTLGPSMDGGYWLVGMRRFIPEVFDIAAWGGEGVLNATLQRVKDAGLRYAPSSTLLDVDTPEDVNFFLSHADGRDSATRRCLSGILNRS